MKRHSVFAHAAPVLLGLSLLTLISSAWAQTETPGATSFGMVGITRGQSLKLNLLAWPPGPCVGPTSDADTAPPAACVAACTATLGFTDSMGNMLGATKTVTLALGDSTSLMLNGDTIIPPVTSILVSAPRRMEVLPMVTGGGSSCFATVEVIDNLLQVAVLGVPGAYPPQPLGGFPPSPIMGVLSVAPMETVRLNVVAWPPPNGYPPCPCDGELSFMDMNGNMVGKTLMVDLPAGQATYLDLPGSTLFPSGPVGSLVLAPMLVHPVVTVYSGVVGVGDTAPVASSCNASVEAISNVTGRTVVYWPPQPIYPPNPI